MYPPCLSFPAAAAVFLQGGICSSWWGFAEPQLWEGCGLSGRPLGYCNEEYLTCNHRTGNSWAPVGTQGVLLTSTCSLLCHCRPLAFSLFGFWILSGCGLPISPNKGKRTEYKQISRQMLNISVHATLSSLLCGCSFSHSVCPLYFTACTFNVWVWKGELM